jgi:hypothetical protein
MKSFPICWNKTLAQLGFRRKIKKSSAKRLYGRRPLFESLETREMLTANTYEVTTLDDVVDNIGLVSLREALAQAASDGATNDNDIITFAPHLSGGTLTLSSQLLIDSNVTINGLGSGVLTSAAACKSRSESPPSSKD